MKMVIVVEAGRLKKYSRVSAEQDSARKLRDEGGLDCRVQGDFVIH